MQIGLLLRRLKVHLTDPHRLHPDRQLPGPVDGQLSSKVQTGPHPVLLKIQRGQEQTLGHNL